MSSWQGLLCVQTLKTLLLFVSSDCSSGLCPYSSLDSNSMAAELLAPGKQAPGEPRALALDSLG